MKDKRIKRFIPVILILFLGILYQYKYYNEFPSHIHAWAQSDRYALSLGFLENGLNLFKPQTFVYNHQFPDQWMKPSEKTITAVDFPIHDYIPAIIMKITGNSHPVIFRLYILLYSFLGLFFLFKLSWAITENYLKSVLVLLFGATSPIFVYYQSGFLPTIPSLSNAIVGIWFYYLYLKDRRNSRFNVSIIFLTLAALSRTTFAIPLIAVFGIEFIRVLKKETTFIKKVMPVGLSLLVILSYFFYNGHLREQYGSIFLNHFRPADRFEEIKEIIKKVYENWFYQYFTKLHYVLFILFSFFLLFNMVRHKPTIQKRMVYFGLLIIVNFIGCILFTLLMFRQFPAHDYYFLDTFFFPVILAFLIIMAYMPIPENRYIKMSSITVLFILYSILIIQPLKTQEKRRETGFWDKTEFTLHNFENASAFLDSLGVSDSAKILVIDAVAPNIPFILMNRKGMAVMHSSKETIEEALHWEFDYIVTQNEYFIPEIYTHCPAIVSKIKKVADNGKISVFIQSEENEQGLTDLIGIADKVPVFEKYMHFENLDDSTWQNLNFSTNVAFSGNASGYHIPDKVFGISYSTKQLPALKSASRIMYFTSCFLTDKPVSCHIVVAIQSNGQKMYYKTINLKSLINQNNQWIKVSQLFQLPKIEKQDYEFSIYMWNTGKSEFYYDDFGFSIY